MLNTALYAHGLFLYHISIHPYYLPRCLSEDINCIEATRVLALCLLVRDGMFEQGAERVSDVLQFIDRFEPSNHGLYYDTSLAFARLVCMYIMIEWFLLCIIIYVGCCFATKPFKTHISKHRW